MNLIQLFTSFCKVGTLAHGRDPSMIALVLEKVLDVHGWMATEEFGNGLAGTGPPLPTRDAGLLDSMTPRRCSPC